MSAPDDKKRTPPPPQPLPRLVAGLDFYTSDDGYMVFTEHFLKKRGYCCESGCRHCPYGFIKGGGR